MLWKQRFDDCNCRNVNNLLKMWNSQFTIILIKLENICREFHPTCGSYISYWKYTWVFPREDVDICTLFTELNNICKYRFIIIIVVEHFGPYLIPHSTTIMFFLLFSHFFLHLNITCCILLTNIHMLHILDVDRYKYRCDRISISIKHVVFWKRSRDYIQTLAWSV